MKILIIPDIEPDKQYDTFTIVHTLVQACHAKEIECIVSAPDTISFDCPVYDAPRPKIKLLFEPGKSYEEYLYNSGKTNTRYLHKDLASISSCIIQEKPDLILDLGRASASIAARIYHRPFYSFVNRAVYKDSSFDSSALSALNELLTENNLEQVLYYHDLLSFARKRICFSPDIVQTFTNNDEIDRCIPVLPFIENDEKNTSVSMFITKPFASNAKINKLIKQTFLGAPFKLNVYVSGNEFKKEENIRFLDHVDLACMKGNPVIIHDADEYLFHVASTLGIPQIIINDGSPNSVYQCAAIKRRGFGMVVANDEFTVASIYEAYRRVISNPDYTNRAKYIRNEILKQEPILNTFKNVSRF